MTPIGLARPAEITVRKTSSWAIPCKVVLGVICGCVLHWVSTQVDLQNKPKPRVRPRVGHDSTYGKNLRTVGTVVPDFLINLKENATNVSPNCPENANKITFLLISISA